MDIFLQQIVNGVTLGSIYALVALGYTMVYGIIGLINFAHGDVVMVGALTAFTVITGLLGAGAGLPVGAVVALGLAAAILVCTTLAFGIERVAYRPLRRAARLAPLITAIGVSIVLQNTAMMIWGRNYLRFPELWQSRRFVIAGASITSMQVAIVLVSVAVMALLLLMIHYTKLGTAMRATAQNPEVAGLMGININTAISIAFVIGAALAAAAGFMVMAYYQVAHYHMGFILGLKAFTAAVLGGIGNLGGAMLGGLLLGVVEALGAGYIGDLTFGFLGSNYQDVFAFFVLILVLIFRPLGLLGERAGDRA
ncbi:MAG: branched-chain amino acid ABC transporter permease [Burkholderiales bacterium]|nr:branched-chain amino acid ABC transporter permease [Burkholderiales bacterium]